MADRARGGVVVLAVMAGLLGGCGVPEAPELWTSQASQGPPPRAPVGQGWAFVAAGSYAPTGGDDDDASSSGLQGPTEVYAGYRGEGPPEREFSAAELQRAGFRGFSAPAPAASFEGPPTEPRARAARFQPLGEVPR